MTTLINQHKVFAAVDAHIGIEVCWRPDGEYGKVQPDGTILWNDGFHQQRSQMNDDDLEFLHFHAKAEVQP